MLQALVMLQPKVGEQQDETALTGGGYRALALLTWFARTWELLNREQV